MEAAMYKCLVTITAALTIVSTGGLFASRAEAGGAQAKTLTPPTVGKRRPVVPPLAISDFSSSSAPTKSKSKPNR
jgi:hypothetical protein